MDTACDHDRLSSFPVVHVLDCLSLRIMQRGLAGTSPENRVHIQVNMLVEAAVHQHAHRHGMHALNDYPRKHPALDAKLSANP